MKNEKTEKTEKTRIYNVIILDASGSMSSLSNAVVEGVNEVISGINKAVCDYSADQEHFFTLASFNNNITKVYDRQLVDSIPSLARRDYRTGGCTALYDAIGVTLTDLEKVSDADSDAVGAVTIITDGCENASSSYTLQDVASIIDRLKEKGWTFAFMGANQDVDHTTTLLHIENFITFQFNEEGMRETWRRDREAKERYYQRMESARDLTRNMSCEERRRFYRDEERHNNYFEPQEEQSGKSYMRRVTPDNISRLNPGEVFVFGSNIDGFHNGGAAKFALIRFGAEMGKGEGMMGHSYAIPTSNGMQLLVEAVARFTEFARQHPEKRFLVTAVGCGVSGYRPDMVAPLFREASTLNNVTLPESFWSCI